MEREAITLGFSVVLARLSKELVLTRLSQRVSYFPVCFPFAFNIIRSTAPFHYHFSLSSGCYSLTEDSSSGYKDLFSTS